MGKIGTPRGTYDLLTADRKKFRYIEDQGREVAKLYDFSEVSTPIFEKAEVFVHNLGDSSDVVSKELYMFEDRNGEKFVLRPEGTAAITRLVCENSLTREPPVKLFYFGPMFRYERPQKGRQRQFHQLGFEYIGVQDPQVDVEVIHAALTFLNRLGIQKNIVLEINSLGDEETRSSFRSALVEYLATFKEQLSEDSKKRLETNPLRVLDSKDAGDQDILINAPKLEDYYSEKAQDYFAKVQSHLKALGVDFKVNSKLVRGLDYYNHTVFEITTDQLGAQSAVIAGGRYDGLTKKFDGSLTPAFGWGAGVERLMLLLDEGRERHSGVKLALVPGNEEEQSRFNILASLLRESGVPCHMIYSGKFKKRINKAEKSKCSHFVSIDFKNNLYKLKAFNSDSFISLSIDEEPGVVVEWLKSELSL